MYAMHFTNFSKSLEKKPAPCTLHFVDDERVTCGTCRQASKVEGSEFVGLKKAREMKAQGKQIGMAGDKKEVAGNWLKLSWLEWQCQATGAAALPLDLPHHCHMFAERGAATPAESVESTPWWELT
jgi:hypothetical protein